MFRAGDEGTMIHELDYVYSRQQQASGRMLQNQHLEHNISSGKTFTF